jgi:hypothetical protein
MNQKLTDVNVGDRVIVSEYRQFPARVTKIYRVDRDGNETPWDFQTSLIYLDLDWGELGKSRVKLHERGKTWYSYSEAN